MQGYVGKDVTEIVVDHGPPSNVFEMPDGRFAFQWSETASYTEPTNTTINSYGSYAYATTYGGYTSSWECFYTFFAKPNPQNSYTVVGFKQPNWECE